MSNQRRQTKVENKSQKAKTEPPQETDQSWDKSQKKAKTQPHKRLTKVGYKSKKKKKAKPLLCTCPPPPHVQPLSFSSSESKLHHEKPTG